MENLGTLFMLVGVGYTCYVVMELLVRLDYQVRRGNRND